MLDKSTREAILRLKKQGHGARPIARMLGVSRGAVKEVLKDGTSEVPELERASQCEPHHARIVELLPPCKGNLVRVHEKLVEEGAELSYQALTAYCRRHGLGKEALLPAGQYEFLPGEEMQHDTSPHDVVIGGRKRRAQTAGVVLCYSRMLFFQLYPRFTRFECKVFLTEAALYFQGVCARWMIDNTHVVVLSGTGKDMVPVPEMAAFAARFGGAFAAHEKGDANRSAHVERSFDYIDNNFLAGREFTDWAHVNREARAFCDKANATVKRHLHASPRELFATELLRLVPLPAYVPDVYQIHDRIVDSEGYVNVHTNRYSAPWRLIGRRLEVRETKDRIELYDGPRRVAAHARVLEPADVRVTLPEHRPPRGSKVLARGAPSPEERELAKAEAEVTAYVTLLKKRGRSLHALRRLMGMLRDYPREPLLAAVRIAAHYGLDDLDRLESLVLRHIAGDFFPLPGATAGDPREVGEADRQDDEDHHEPDTGDAPEGDDTAAPEDDDEG
jgi:transposase